MGLEKDGRVARDKFNSERWQMKRASQLVFVGLVVFLFSVLFITPSSFASTMTLDVQAYIDGRDRLTLQGSTLTWNHYDYDRPGTNGGANAPVYISTTLDGNPVLTNVEWWDPRNQNTAVYTGLSPAVPATEDVTPAAVQARSSLWMVQAPNAGNSYTTIIEFNDNGPGGAAWYEARLTYTAVPLPGAILLFAPGLAGLAAIRRRFKK